MVGPTVLPPVPYHGEDAPPVHGPPGATAW